MKKLLTHIGLNDFISLSIRKQSKPKSDDLIVDASRFTDYSVKKIYSGRIPDDFLERIDDLPNDVPWIFFDSEFTLDCLSKSRGHKAIEEFFSVRQLWDALELTRILFPDLTAYSIENIENVIEFPFEKKHTSSEKLIVIVLYLIEGLARVDLRKLSLLVKFTEHSRSPLKILFKKIAEHNKAGAPTAFQFPKVKIPLLPSNTIGDDSADSEPDSAQPVPEKAIHTVFEHGGLLNAHFDNYEERAQQVKLALAIAAAFNQSQFVLAEAGTGTGKSLAYLVPAIYWTSQNSHAGESVVISTHTKNLQEQLFYKDIPQLRKILPIPFYAVLLKGRGNYICMKKWKTICLDPAGHLTPTEREKVLPVIFWIDRTQTGDISECSGFQHEQNMSVWNKLASESAYCQAQKCNSSDECFVKKIRDAARKAQVTVVNHSLLFSDIISENAILGDYTNLIIDEAHHVEKTAQNYLGVGLSLWSVKNFVISLYERDQLESGVLLQLKQKLTGSRLSKGESTGYSSLLAEATMACTEFWIKTQELFTQLTIEATSGRSVDFEDTSVLKTRSRENKLRYDSKNAIWKNTKDELSAFFATSAQLDDALLKLIDRMKDWKSDIFEDGDTMKDMLILKRDELKKILETAQFLSDSNDIDYVYWYELPAKERSYDIRFYGVPLNVADILKARLYEKLNTCVFSSATLSVAGNFNYYKSRSGLMELDNVKQFSVGSPFDFNDQCRIFIPSFLPDPSSADFSDASSTLIEKIILENEKGTLALFTSYAMMNKCYRDMKRRLKNRSITLLMQGQDGSRSNVTQRFFDERTSVLFGTDSFWEGVDVPGESLEILIITKLPFEVPSDPLVAAKMERVTSMGGNSFFDYSVPEAVIKFRQGFGRLIRSRSDRGIVVILDNRVISKNYGRLFLNSLPAAAQTISSESMLLKKMSDFFTSYI
ncbi:DEAD/DEAH box helicase [bacterium]|nr:MAG: DEAD/DEAH box helicase [bacterium]